jgi:hypothetical protein
LALNIKILWEIYLNPEGFTEAEFFRCQAGHADVLGQFIYFRCHLKMWRKFPSMISKNLGNKIVIRMGNSWIENIFPSVIA